MSQKNWRTPVAIVIGAALVAVAIVLAPGPSGLDRAAVERIVDEKLSGDEFDQRVEAGIVAFVESQRRGGERQRQQQARNLKPPQADDHVRGAADARITLIEYSDYECPYCKRFHETVTTLVAESEGRVNWIYRHLPLAMHNPGARKQAEAAECAALQGGDEAFWAYSDAIFERTRSNGNGFPVDRLEPLAGELGLDIQAFGECMRTERTAQRVEQDIAEGEAAGVTGTPGNFLVDNATGRIVAVHGARPLADLRKVVDRMLEQPSE